MWKMGRDKWKLLYVTKYINIFWEWGVNSCFVLSHKKEWNWVICRDMDGPRECHTEWSKPERGKQISCNNAYMQNLEKWYRWSYLQSRNRDTDVENKCMDTKVGWGGRYWETGIDTYTLLILKKKRRKKPQLLWLCF